MSFSDIVEGIKIAQKRRIEKEKEKSIQNVTVVISSFADNAVGKFKTEYFIQSSKGKRCCIIHFNPYPDQEIMRKVLSRLSKKEYLSAFEQVLAAKLKQQGFSDYTLSENIFNSKEPATLKVRW